MNGAVRWLKASFLLGAVVDGVVGILMLIPSRMGETGFRYPMGLGASLMFGWTVLLLWGYRKPVERKGILVITIFPVITGIVATMIYQYASGAFPLARVLPGIMLGAGLIAFLGFSSFKARSVE
jgi:hypothetical protein